ncbi:MAG: PilZ domain-containing protein [Oscillospiraceae bacterium]|nr:PilZ domain-containing protein [Oscillospiraceae bacterium]
MDRNRCPVGAPTSIKTGTKLTITLDGSSGVSPDFQLSSVFEHDTENGRFIIDAPMYRGNLYPLGVGRTLFFSYYRNKMRYDFQGVVRDRFKRGDMFYIDVERMTDILRTQRREDFRLDLLVDAMIIWEEVGEDGTTVTQEIYGLTHDVSGGGAAVCVDTPLREYERVRIRLLIPSTEEPVSYTAETRWTTRRENDTEFKYLCGLKFLFESRLDKEGLLNILFRIQQQRMRVDIHQPFTQAELPG